MVPPPHEPLRPLGIAMTSPAGRLSVKATPVSCVPTLGLVMVKESEVLPPMKIEAAPKVLAMVGATGALTVIEALVVLPVPPSVEETCVELFFTPAVVPVTLAWKVHDALAASVAVASVI